tara:strand:- start:1163 stop:1780 length:618 start_codon:yes stop_codon:yes gene_type:complete
MDPKKKHWENVFQTKTPQEVSWTEAYPKRSIELIQSFNLDKSASIIDIGGGDSQLVDALLELDFTNLSVLDISGKALERAQKRLGERARYIHWIESDIIDFNPTKNYTLWHDRASFHFLTDSSDIQKYTEIVTQSNAKHLVIGTFSTYGPEKCSGLLITQYDCKKLKNCFSSSYNQVDCIEIEHITPFNSKQDFIFSRFNIEGLI